MDKSDPTVLLRTNVDAQTDRLTDPSAECPKGTNETRLPSLSQRSGPKHRKATLPSARWENRYRTVVIIADVLATFLITSIGGVVLASLGVDQGHLPLLAFMTTSALLLGLVSSWNSRVLGQGADEFARLGRGVFAACVALAFSGLLLGQLEVRPWVFIIAPAVGALSATQRYLLRRVLHRERRKGNCLLPVIAAGSPDTLRDLIARTRAESHVGWKVEGVCVPKPERIPGGEVAGVPVLGHLDDVSEQVMRGGYRMVAVTADSHWNSERLQALAWELEETEAEMVVAPALMEIAGPRLHVSGVLGMPLLHLAEPVFTGGRRIIKAAADRVGALLLLTLCAPLFVLIALAVKFGDGGPVFYRQPRSGRDGATFTMLKFRTMVVGAHSMRGSLDELNEAEGPLFKVRNDPRVTKVGTLLRRYSLDELPQLINVLYGQMSLVGPRPPLPEETEEYNHVVRRRLLVSPGLTGLWQVSGRSDLSWEDSIRLDLRYVENWSLALDALILWKTVRAVLTKHGAY